MFYFVGVKGVIRSYRSAQELKADTLKNEGMKSCPQLSTPLTSKKLRH